jgi:cysteinyl-tRNA synthetase
MTLRVYNTLSKQKELFEPVKPGKVGIYLCGPTVYSSPHIGHMVGPVIFDAVKRYLRYKGFEVTLIVNITDVEDKLIDAARKTNVTVQEIAQKYTKEYLDCLSLLGIDTIDHFPKASEHMKEIIDISQKLIERGFAYAVDGNVWFDVSKDSDYGKLSNRRLEDQEAGNRSLEAGGKRNAADFALWKSAKPGAPSWDSPWGKGRPGWHIECSAMSMKFLGPTFDIHGGGMDLMFPHHENELAQSECCTGQPLARFWMHNGLTRLKTKLAGGEWADEKMSKSLGNVIGAQELIATHGPDLVRYFLLATHYRRPIEFTDAVMSNSKKGMSVFTRLFERIERLTGQPLSPNSPDVDSIAATLLDSPQGPFIRAALNLKIKFMEMMDDDFNTAGAIAAMHEMAGESNSFIERLDLEKTKNPEELKVVACAAVTIRNLAMLVGLFRGKPAGTKQDDALTEHLMGLLIQLRQEARKTKNFALADGIRDGLLKIGVTLEDRADGTIWRKE